MKLLTSDIGRRVWDVLAGAQEARIASAFFCPSDSMIAHLNRVPKLTLIVSEEYAVNDPVRLELLSHCLLRSVPTDSRLGKLHAKVFLATYPDGSRWGLVGSANLTELGLFGNQEACIELSSGNPEDRTALAEVDTWFRRLFSRAHEIDFADARERRAASLAYRLERRPKVAKGRHVEYWAIKTTSGGSDAKDHWSRLFEEKVVGIGWEELNVNPAEVTDDDLRKALISAFPANSPRRTAFALSTIRKFVNMPEGSIVLLCRGFVANQKKLVYIYAYARVTGPFQATPQDGDEWRFLRPAAIQEIGVSLPVTVVATALEKDAMRQTMHELTKETFHALASVIGDPILI
jgi:PLD-like domain